MPFFWGLNGMLLCSSGTAGTRRLRGRTPPSWNEVHVDATTIKVFLHYLDGTRELAVIFSRKTRALTREAFYVTDDFLRGIRSRPFEPRRCFPRRDGLRTRAEKESSAAPPPLCSALKEGHP